MKRGKDIVENARKNGLRLRESRKNSNKKKKLIKAYKFRSKFEGRVYEGIPPNLRESVGYESVKVSFVQPAVDRTYTPDFILPNGIYIEAKGRLTLEDRKKSIMVRNSNPGIDIRFVFQEPHRYIRKGSKTTYAMWAENNNFLWAKNKIPLKWLTEKKLSTS